LLPSVMSYFFNL